MLTTLLLWAGVFVVTFLVALGIFVGSQYGARGCGMYLGSVVVLVVVAYRALEAWVFGG
jgi:hypothetical protein